MRMPNGALTSLAGNVDPHHRGRRRGPNPRPRRGPETVERLVGEHEPDVVGLSVMTFQRRTAKGIIDLVRTRRPSVARRRRRLRSEPRARGLTRIRTAASTSSCAAKARSRSGSCCARSRHGAASDRHCGPVVSEAPTDSAHNPARAVSGLEDGEIRPPRARRASARGLHAARPAGRRDRDLARLHLRLQLLLDYRDARTQLPHLRLRARLGRHRATRGTAARDRSSSWTTTSR